MSDLSTPKAFIANAERVTDVYGEWPTFHDSEVLSLSLDRGKQPELQPTMTVRIWTFMPHRGQTDEKGYYTRSRYSIITFLFERPNDLIIEDFNHQNVLAGIVFREVGAMVEVKLEGLFGINATLVCSRVCVERIEMLS